MEQPTQKPRHLTALDRIILISLLLCLLFGSALLYWRYNQPQSEAEIIYTLLAPAVDAACMRDGAFVLVGDAVFSENGTAYLGEVRQVDVTPYLQASVVDGQVVFLEHEELFDLTLQIRVRGSICEGMGVRVSDIRIAAGECGAYRVGDLYLPHAQVSFVETVGRMTREEE